MFCKRAFNEWIQETKTRGHGAFFDSFKHFKHNLSNLLCVELPTLKKLGVEKYLNLIATNYKSKYPDMRKIGLIEYDKPSNHKYVLTEEARNILDIIEPFTSVYNENIIKLGRKNVDSMPLEPFIKQVKDNEIYQNEILKLVLSYYDTADLIRPYLALLNIIRHYKITKLNAITLQHILANKKERILSINYDENAFNTLDNELKAEIKRPITYIHNCLKTALVIDSNDCVIVDFAFVDRLQNDMNAIVLYEPKKARNSRPAREQKIFRENILKAYNYQCAITKKAILIDDIPLLEAAHIIPYSNGGSFAISNGIALSYEMHKMFDRGLFGFVYDGKNIRVKISQSSKINDKHHILKALNYQILSLPKNPNDYPNPLALKYHLETFVLE